MIKIGYDNKNYIVIKVTERAYEGIVEGVEYNKFCGWLTGNQVKRIDFHFASLEDVKVIK